MTDCPTCGRVNGWTLPDHDSVCACRACERACWDEFGPSCALARQERLIAEAFWIGLCAGQQFAREAKP